MEKSVEVKTTNGNRYLYNSSNKSFLFCHPLLSYFINAYQNNRQIYSEEELPKVLHLNSKINFDEDEIKYYHKKFTHLFRFGFIGPWSTDDLFQTDLSSEVTDNTLANISNIVFEVTDTCNLKCKYCGYGEFYNDYDSRANLFMDFSVAKKIFDFLLPRWSSNWNRSLKQNVNIGFYGGEPLLNMNFIRSVVDYVDALSIKERTFTFNMTTNGVLLDRYLDYLIEKDFQLLISLDGNKQNHSYRVDHNNKNSYEKVIKNIRLLREKAPEYFKRRVGFNAVLHDRNSVPEIQAAIYDEFEKVPQISPLNNSGIIKEKLDEYNNMFKSYYDDISEEETMQKLVSERFASDPNVFSLTQFINWYNDNVYLNYHEILLKINRKKIPSGTCLPFNKKMFITVNGKILPCERISHRFSLGTINEEVELDIDAISEYYQSLYKKIIKQCSNCFRSQNCPQCLFQLETITHEKTLCTAFSNKESFSNYLSRIISLLENDPEIYNKVVTQITLK